LIRADHADQAEARQGTDAGNGIAGEDVDRGHAGGELKTE
jgi:hypothetical protein